MAVAISRPTVDLSPSLIQWHVEPDAAALTFGTQAGGGGLAARALAQFRAGGVTRVAHMAGNFSAVIVERAARRISVVGTLLGHRSLFHHTTGDHFSVSPHDLTLLATGQVPYALDYSTLASMVACDWSLGGRSLLAGLARCHPLEAICREAGETRLVNVDALRFDARIDARDRTQTALQLDRVVEELLSSVRSQVQGLERLRCSLTAGMDSRAVLAALRGATHGVPIWTSTSGGDDSQDVVVARRLASLVGAAHERQEPIEPTLDDFEGTLRLKAFFSSGDTSAKRAMTRLPSIDPRAEPLAGGSGGEIYRGFFYPYFGPTGTAPRGVDRIAASLTRFRFRRLAGLPFADPASARDVRERLSHVLRRLEQCSPNAHDVVDLFYLFERYGRWGAAPASQPWTRSWTPFESTAAIRAAFQLPAPIGQHESVHSLLIRRFLPPRAFWIPINGGQLLLFDGPGRLRYATRQTLNVASLVTQRVRRRLKPDARRADDLKASFLRRELGQFASALMEEEGSASRELFGLAGVRSILDSHRKGSDQLATIGIALTAEMWRRMAREIAAAR